MASSEVLSTVANAFSVDGLADVVFKYGREVVETLVKTHDAPKDVRQLLTEVKDVEARIGRIRIFISDFVQSSLPQKNKDVIPAIEALLLRCPQEFILIHKSIKEASILATDGLFGKFRKSARWVWNEQEVAASSREMARLSRELDSILLLTGRQNGLALHREITSARADIAQASSASNQAHNTLSNITRSVDDKVELISRNLDTLTKYNVVQMHGLSSAVLDARNAILAGMATIDRKLGQMTNSSETRCAVMHHDIRTETSTVRKDLRSISKEIKHSRKQHLRHQKAANTEILTRLGEVQSDIATLSLTRTAEDAFTFEGSNLESVTFPLMLLHSELTKALPTLKSQAKIRVSQSEAFWVQQKFEEILAASHDLSAKAARTRATGSRHSTKRSNHWKSVSDPIYGHLRALQKTNNFKGPQRQRELTYWSKCQPTAVGILEFIRIRSEDVEDPGDTELHSITISFYPKVEFGQPGISSNFSYNQSFGILPSLRVFNITPRTCSAFIAVRHNDVPVLRRLFDTGTASPSDRTPDGYSLAAEAVRSKSSEVFELLLQQGAGIHEFQSAYDGFCDDDLIESEKDWTDISHMLSSVILRRSEVFDCFEYYEILINLNISLFYSLLKESLDSFMLTANVTSPLKSFLEMTGRFSYDENVQQVGYMLPVTSMYICAVLMGKVGFSGSFPIRQLYETLGIDLKWALSSGVDGETILHIIFGDFDMISWEIENLGLAIPLIVEILELGAPINQANHKGDTPTDEACECASGLTIWTAAVSRAGYRLEQVYCGDGTTLAEIWQAFLDNSWRIPKDENLIRACGLDQLGEIAEAILEDSLLLRGSWIYAMEIHELVLSDSTETRAV